MLNIPATYQPEKNKQIAEGIFSTEINELFYVQHATFPDERGFFSELAKIPDLEKILGFIFETKQINQSRSEKNVVRGIHAEDWNKLITVTSGYCFSAVVDVRPESSTFGKKELFLLGSGENALDGSLFIPSRCGNSICVLDGPVDYLYVVDQLYTERDTSHDVAISLFDKDLAIPWPIPREEMIISQRDLESVTLHERFPEKFI